MKKQYKLGVALVGMLGAILFGGRSPAGGLGVAVAEAGEPVDLVLRDPSFELGSARDGSQTLASLGVQPSQTPITPTAGLCPEGMVEVEGDYCPNVEQKCIRWLDPESKMRCAEFDTGTTCYGHTVHKHFCIDRFEYPNIAGEKPVVMKDWYEAKSTCEAEGKRLCGDSEWTLACEGQERLPYPYGYARNAEACNIDRPHLDVDENAIADASRRADEVARLDQRTASGSHEACVSPFGAYDMTGNVDEWVVNEGGHPYKSGLKGGYWGPVRDRCRPMTVAHNELFEFYQIGFRCCGDSRSPSVGAHDGAPGSGKAIGRSIAANATAQGTILAGS
jgi:hypothetical protein